MGFIKSYKNIIILIIIISSIVFSTSIVEFGKDMANKLGEIFSASKPDYSNLSNAGYKVQSSSRSGQTTKSSTNSSSSSKNEGARSMFKNNQKEQSPEELDKQIMEQNQKDDQARRKELFERSTRQFDKGVDQKKMADEKFNMDMEKEFKDF